MATVINPADNQIDLLPDVDYSFTPVVNVQLQVTTPGDVLWQFAVDTGNWSVLEARESLVIPATKLVYLRSGNYVSKLGRTDV